MNELTVADLYAAGLERHLALAAELTDADGELPTAACPLWRVKDVYAHLAGACADVLEGRVEGAGSDEWTGRQVAERRDRSLSDNVAEYAERGPALVEALRGFPIERLAIDQWTHEQDVRGAVGRQGSREEPVVAWAVGLIMSGQDAARRKRGRPALEVEGTSGTWAVGEGDPAASIRASDFELVRGALGRRSPSQLRSWMAPGGDPKALDGFAIFGPRDTDLVE